MEVPIKMLSTSEKITGNEFQNFNLNTIEGKLNTLKIMMISREAEIRENILFRQGRGLFHLPSAGHEAMCAISPSVREGDWTYCYYRDRALLLGNGVPLLDIALGFFAKEGSSSGGRQMASHFSYAPLNIASCATPTGLQCLPAAGTAWAIQRENKPNVVFCNIGDASTRQGEFFEAVAFSLQEKLPIIFLVEDNGYGISTATDRMTPLALDFFNKDIISIIDGRNATTLQNKIAPLIDAVRNGAGPRIAWIKLDRLMSHTSSDDHTKYRSIEDLKNMDQNDPIALLKREIMSIEDFSELLTQMENEAKIFVKEVYKEAEASVDPDPKAIKEHLFSEFISPKRMNLSSLTDAKEISMADAFNLTLKKLLSENNKAMIFGEDVEDPKGGVFNLTKGLSTLYPQNVINSPLAEATIAGLASGLAAENYLPIFELQFIDFVGTAFNQIVNQIATLRWRTVGAYKCPLIIYAPCGSFISGGGPWHSQTNESWFAHAPGLKIYMPNNANDAASMLYNAAYSDDPVLILLPKNQLQKKMKIEPDLLLYPEKAVVRKQGEHISVVTWGNCTELALSCDRLLEKRGIDIEIIDIRSIVPCDWNTIYKSVMKTGRLMVLQEDNKTCSFGQAIISEVISQKEVWNNLYSAPLLVSRDDIHIGFNAELEKAVLPDLDKIIFAAEKLVGRIN